jgi:hypothetical protein
VPRLDQAELSAFRDRTLGPTRLRGFCAGSSSSCLLSDSRLCTNSPLSPKLRAHRQCGRDPKWNWAAAATCEAPWPTALAQVTFPGRCHSGRGHNPRRIQRGPGPLRSMRGVLWAPRPAGGQCPRPDRPAGCPRHWPELATRGLDRAVNLKWAYGQTRPTDLHAIRS